MPRSVYSHASKDSKTMTATVIMGEDNETLSCFIRILSINEFKRVNNNVNSFII